MRLMEMKYLEPGDHVKWCNPDNVDCAGIYRVLEIVTETGLIEHEESVLVLSDLEGHCTEVYASELA